MDPREFERRFQESVNDKGELERLFNQLLREALADPLTGLYNRRYFQRRLKEEVARFKRHGGGFALVFLDIDDFKAYNDQFGHGAGDQLLRQVAGVFHESIREPDVVARYGGEEFTMLLPETDREGAEKVVNRLLEAWRRADIAATVSGGIAVCPEDGTSPERLLKAADRALYAAKQAGKDRIRGGAGEGNPEEGRFLGEVHWGFVEDDPLPSCVWIGRDLFPIVRVERRERDPGYMVYTWDRVFRVWPEGGHWWAYAVR